MNQKVYGWSSISGTYVSVFSENCGHKCEQRFNQELFNTSMIPPYFNPAVW